MDNMHDIYVHKFMIKMSTRQHLGAFIISDFTNTFVINNYL